MAHTAPLDAIASTSQQDGLDARASRPQKTASLATRPPITSAFPSFAGVFVTSGLTGDAARWPRSGAYLPALLKCLDPAIDGLTFTPIGGGEEMTWKASLDANYTDGMLILHRGEIVYEYYSGCLDREGRHGA